jgi:proliferating cell nuclear antigen
MSFSYSNTIFNNVVELLNDLVDVCTFNFTKKYLEILTLDTNNVLLFSCKLEKKVFETYKIKKNTNVTVRLSELNKILKCKKPEDVITFKFAEDTLKISQVNTEKKKKCNFSLRLLSNDDDDNELEEIEIDDDNYFVAKSSSLTNIYKDISKFGDCIKFQLSDNEVTFSTYNTGNAVEMSYGENEDDILSIQNQTNVHATLLSKYLGSILKADKLCNEMKVVVSSEDFPVLFDCEIRSGSYVRFFLSPKMDDEE